MAVPTFTPPKAPDRDPSGDTEFRVRRAKFGDGYGQRSQDGLNTEKEAWTLTWSLLSDAQRDAILGFIRARGGAEAFDYTLPGETVAKRWIAPRFNQNRTAFGVNKVQVTIERVYDL